MGLADDPCMDSLRNTDSARPLVAAPEAGGSSADLQRMDLGGMALLVPLSSRAMAWLLRECQIEPWQTVMVNECEGVAVEHRNADEIMEAWEAN